MEYNTELCLQTISFSSDIPIGRVIKLEINQRKVWVYPGYEGSQNYAGVWWGTVIATKWVHPRLWVHSAPIKISPNSLKHLRSLVYVEF